MMRYGYRSRTTLRTRFLGEKMQNSYLMGGCWPKAVSWVSSTFLEPRTIRRSRYIMRVEVRHIRLELRVSFSFIIFLSDYTTSRCSELIRATSMALRSSQERHNYIWRPDKRAGLWKMPKSSIRAADTAVWACIMEKWRILTGSGTFWWPIKLLSKMGSFCMPLSTCDVSLPIRAHITRNLATNRVWNTEIRIPEKSWTIKWAAFR